MMAFAATSAISATFAPLASGVQLAAKFATAPVTEHAAVIRALVCAITPLRQDITAELVARIARLDSSVRIAQVETSDWISLRAPCTRQVNEI